MFFSTPTAGNSADRAQDTTQVNESGRRDNDEASSGWKVMTGSLHGFSIDYILDKNISWSHEAYTHVFIDESFVEFEVLPGAADINRLNAIVQSVHNIAVMTGHGLPHFRVSLHLDQVFITARSPVLLNALWRSPPLFGVRNLRHVRRALPWDDASVWGTHRGASMTMQELEIGCRSMAVGDIKPVAIVARFCKSEDNQDRFDPTGEVLVFCSKLDALPTPRFYGQDLLKQQHGPTIDAPRFARSPYGYSFETIGPETSTSFSAPGCTQG